MLTLLGALGGSWVVWKIWRWWPTRSTRRASRPLASPTTFDIDLWDNHREHALLTFRLNVAPEQVEDTLHQIHRWALSTALADYCPTIEWVTVQTDAFLLLEVRTAVPPRSPHLF